MGIPIYYYKDIDNADTYALVPVTMLSVVITQRKVVDDFILTAVKRFKKQDPNMSYLEIAEKLCLNPDLVKEVIKNIKDVEKENSEAIKQAERFARTSGSGLDDDNQVADTQTLAMDFETKIGGYVIFNQVTGSIYQGCVNAESLKEMQVEASGRFFYKSESKYSSIVSSDFGEHNLSRKGELSQEVRRLLVDVGFELNSDDNSRDYIISDVYPSGQPFNAYILANVDWIRIRLGKGQRERISPDNWRIGSPFSRERADMGMREKIMDSDGNAFKSFLTSLNQRYDYLKNAFDEFERNPAIDEINRKYDLRFGLDLQQLIAERQVAITNAVTEQERRGVIEKCYGVLEREIYAILDRESKTRKEKIRDRVKAMHGGAKKQAVALLFADAGLVYKQHLYDYFAGVYGTNIHGMFFGDRQASLFATILALLVRYSMDKNHASVERLKNEYSDFMIEFDNLDILEKRNKGKHEAQVFEVDGVIRFCGRMEKALFGVNIIEELGFAKAEKKQTANAYDGQQVANRIGIKEGSELSKRFADAYTSFLNEDSSFYANCENVLVELYGIILRGATLLTDKQKRNDLCVSALILAGFDKAEIESMRLLKAKTSAAGERLLAQSFLDMIALSASTDKRFIDILTQNKQTVRLINDLYEAIGHHGKPFDFKQCPQFYELIETQFTQIKQKFSGGK